MNTSHEGSMTTIQMAPFAARCLETVGADGHDGQMGLPIPSSCSQIASMITLVVQPQRIPDG